MTVREVLKLLYKDGWKEIEGRTKGSHIQLKHPAKAGRTKISDSRGHAVVPIGSETAMTSASLCSKVSLPLPLSPRNTTPGPGRLSDSPGRIPANTPAPGLSLPRAHTLFRLYFGRQCLI